jgi:hypothetical protein
MSRAPPSPGTHQSQVDSRAADIPYERFPAPTPPAMIVPAISTTPTGIGRLTSPGQPAVDAVRAVRPLAPGAERRLYRMDRRDRARAGLRARIALGLDAVFGSAEPQAGIDAGGQDMRPAIDRFVDTLETALRILVDAEAHADTDPPTLLVRLTYGHANDGFARLLERLGSADIEREVPALAPVRRELAARFGELIAAAPVAGRTPPTLTQLLATVAEQRGDLVSAEA